MILGYWVLISIIMIQHHYTKHRQNGKWFTKNAQSQKIHQKIEEKKYNNSKKHQSNKKWRYTSILSAYEKWRHVIKENEIGD